MVVHSNGNFLILVLWVFYENGLERTVEITLPVSCYFILWFVDALFVVEDMNIGYCVEFWACICLIFSGILSF